MSLETEDPMTTTKTVKIRKASSTPKSFSTLTDAQKYKVLNRYKLGETIGDIAKSLKVDLDTTKDFIAKEITGLTTVREINKLTEEARGLPMTPINPSTLMNTKFLEDVDDKKEVYAYYYAMTGSNEHALKESKLDLYLPRSITVKTKRYTLGVRGKFIRDLPGIQSYINDIRDMRVKDLRLDKPFIQSELVEQLEQLKELAGDDPKYRGHLLKTIELLGRTMAAFSDTLVLEEANPKTGLEILMARAKSEISEDVTTYEVDNG
jgi:hypothetical protein